jgi:membrane-bound lytic murein transglycosylase D
MISKTFVLFFVFFLLPSYLFAAEIEIDKGMGAENAQHSQVCAVREPISDQDREGFQEDQSVAEMVTDISRTDARSTDSGKGSAAVVSYSSNPVAEKAVQKNIALFTRKLKERFSVYLQRSGEYIELMKDILKSYDIPEDIAFLPLIESGFNPNAYSVARAVGPWQFIASTAKKYGLTIDWWRDERKDPVKSTAAAANYLKDLYDMFGSWNLAMAAYNAGEGKILKALSRTKSDDYWSLLKSRHIKRETKEYVPRFIAAKLIAANPSDYGFDDLVYRQPFEYDEVVLDKPIDLDVAARCAETSLDAIRNLNPEIRRWSTPANVSPYSLRIPYGKKDVFLANLKDIPEDERFSVTSYTVRKGDTIWKISRRSRVPARVIMELNNDGPNIKHLEAGETIYLPPKNKFCLDRDDRHRERRASSKTRHHKRKKHAGKFVVTSLDKKHAVVND